MQNYGTGSRKLQEELNRGKILFNFKNIPKKEIYNKKIYGYIEYNKSESIFLDDPAFSFDYSHILPFSGKCSVLHGHTSSVLISGIISLQAHSSISNVIR